MGKYNVSRPLQLFCQRHGKQASNTPRHIIARENIRLSCLDANKECWCNPLYVPSSKVIFYSPMIFICTECDLQKPAAGLFQYGYSPLTLTYAYSEQKSSYGCTTTSRCGSKGVSLYVHFLSFEHFWALKRVSGKAMALCLRDARRSFLFFSFCLNYLEVR